MSEELHAVTKLLLARMGSHPEEFKDEYFGSDLYPTHDQHRWSRALNAISQYASEEDKQAINEGLRTVHMTQVHEWAMDELLNGPARREEERQKRLEETMYRAAQSTLYTQAAQKTVTANQLLGSGGAPSNQLSTLGSVLKKGLGF